jgi:ubiquinone/menaquinone biosynthesis C-methylase UbiE
MTIKQIALVFVHILLANSSAFSFSSISARLAAEYRTPIVLAAASVDQKDQIGREQVEKKSNAAESLIEKDDTSSISPGLREDHVFDCDESVFFWKEFQSEGNQRNLQRTIVTIINEANRDNMARAYWTSHIIRTGFFTLNAALGTVASDLHARLIANRNGGRVEADDTKGIIFGATDGMFQRLANSELPTRLLREVFLVYAQDYKYVKEGLLKLPWDALIRDNGLQLSHRQSSPLFAFTETLGSIRESVAILSRRNKQSSEGVFMDGTSNSFYPDYYLNDFHYQSDGWMSSDSANKYEASTETLFLGRQDAMQRQTLIPILNSRIKPESILEVACGTGRFGTFTRDNFPTAKTTYSDLSPFYLEKARKNDQYWLSQRGEDAMEEATGEATKPESATFVQANAETLPFEDDSFDVVTCVYLFHELPDHARQKAAAEMVRVVKPGGMIALTDSFQLGDRPSLDEQIGNFSNMNEPHYQNYINTYLPALFEGCDFGEKLMSSSSKTLSFIKRGRFE